MKPLRLEMRAFGPFRGREVVDFAKLPDSLFLIAGPIGAGKTTVLDALCFALYGESSGEGRRPGDLRSHHADPAERTEVTLDFSVGERTYRVTRRPEQELPKKRGEGTTTAKAEATLWERTGAAAPAGDGTLLAAKVRDVDAGVRGILGFDAVQFRRVILLPQGRFREFLSAGSTERRSILRVLFDVSRCEELEGALEAAVGELDARQLAREAARREKLGDEFASREELRLGAAARAAECAAVDARHCELTAAAAKAESSLAEGRRLEALFAALAAAQRAYADLAAKAGDMAALRGELADAERAAPVLPEILALDTLRAEIAAMERDLRAKEQERLGLAQAGESNDRLLAGHREGEAGNERNIVDVDRLKGLRAKVLELENAVRARAAADAARGALEREAAAAESSLRALEQRAGAVEGELPALRAKAGERAALDARLQELARVERGLAASGRAQADLLALGGALEQARAALGRAEAARVEAERAAGETRLRWVRSRAGALAGQLVEGEPCPVCGSPHHPAPVRPSGDAVTEEDLQAAGDARDGAVARERAAAAAVSAAEVKVAEARSRLEALRQSLDADADSDPDGVRRLIVEVGAAGDEARGAGERAARLEAQLADVRAQAAAAAGEVKGFAARLQQAAGDCAAAAAAVKHLEETVPPELRSVDAVEQRLQALAGEVERWRRRLQELEAERTRVASALADVGGFVKATGTELEGKRARAAQASAALGRRLAAAGFADAATCRAAARAEGEVAAARDRLERFNNTLQQAQGALDEARRKVGGVERPELAPLEQARADADRALQECGREAGRLQEQHRALAQRLAELEALEREEAEAGARGEALREIAAAACGRAGRKVKFSTYALAAWFDDVMTHTNRRLALMSSGRYALARVVETAGGGFKGLDLEVHDAHTGRSRPANTLSGGEGFLASLALALGLADSVQSAAGGYRLESVFVDEGFGSLDAESLELAQRCIADLQRTGRLVGLISHVEEMSSWTPARIVIDKSPRGSTIRAGGGGGGA